ncbi:MAG: DUF1353 domain-containing protein [Arenicellales bacterium]
MIKKTMMSALLIWLIPVIGCAGEFGNFDGSVQVEWLRNKNTDDREMRLISPFNYKDPEGFTWHVPKGAIINGASIPRVLWFLGSPFIGDYREASVVHDYFYHQPRFSRKIVDEMFFSACRAGGVSAADAGAMYFTLRAKDRIFVAQARQERLNDQKKRAQSKAKKTNKDSPLIMAAPSMQMKPMKEVTEEDVLSTKQWIIKKNPSLEEIEARAKKYAEGG